MIGNIALIAIGVFLGVIASGFLVKLWADLRAEVAKVKFEASVDVNAVHRRLYDLEAKIGSKLP